MYMSLITPTEGCERAAAHDLADHSYGDHQWIWRFFSAPEGTSRDFLFRRGEVGGLPRFHVVSRRMPQPPSAAWTVQTRAYEPRLLEGDRLRFELRANPTVRHGRDGKSKRHDVVMEAKKLLLVERGVTRWADLPSSERPALYELVRQSCTKWLARRGSRLGFAIDEGSVAAEAYQQHGEKSNREPQFSSVDFSGELTVTDPALLLPALYEGVGRGKAFGCGLLLVRRTD